MSAGTSGSGAVLRIVDSSPRHAVLTVASVYREHANFVVRIARQLGVKGAAAEDIVHDVFLVVHRRLPDYDGRGSIRSWLYGITRRVVMHHHRGTVRAERRNRRGPTPVPAPSPEEDIARTQAARFVQEFLQTLDEPQRMVFVLADIEGMSAPEISDALGVKTNTVYSRLRLARRRFERALAEHHDGAPRRRS